MKSYLAATTFLVSACFMMQPLYAQDAPAQDTSAEQSESAGIQEIIVTAQRKEESLQRAPIAITAVGGADLRSAGVVAPQNLTALVPALQVNNGGVYPLFYIRGVGNFNGNPLSDSAVAVNFNDVYIGRPTSTYGLFYDLERLEVLKGPQGTLYGRNATAGSINIIPRKPKIGEYGGEATLEYGNFDTVRLDAAANIPVSDQAAIRVSGIVARHDGYMNNRTSDQDDVGGRVMMLVEPSSDLSIMLEGDYYSQGGTGAGAVVLPNGVKDRIDVTSPAGGAFYVTQPAGVAGRNLAALPPTTRQNNKFWGTSATVKWDADWGSVTFIPAYRAAKLDFVTNTPGFEIAQRERDRQLSAELRIASNTDQPLQWLIGGFYFDENIKAPAFNVNLQFNQAQQVFKTGVTSAAGFGRLTYEITPSVRLTAGGRYTHEKKFLDGTLSRLTRLCIDLPAFTNAGQVAISGPCPGAAPFTTGGSFPVPAQVPFDPTFPFVGFNEIYGPTAIFQTAGFIVNDEKLSSGRFTWRVGADWDITPRNLLYANYETGFKAGGFFFSADGGSYRPEKIQAYTIGSKNRFLDNRLQLNIEAYYWRYSDQQISALGIDSAQNIIFPTRNIGKATFKGFEIETQVLPFPNTLLRADVQYLDAVYKSFVYQVPNQGPPLTGCQASGLASPSITIDCSGKRPPNAPKWTLNLGAQQTVPLGNGGNFVADARAHFQTETLAGLDFLPGEIQKEYWLVDGSLTYNFPGDRLFLTGFINNAFDKRVVSGALIVPFSSFLIGQLNSPRTYGIRGGFKF